MSDTIRIIQSIANLITCACTIWAFRQFWYLATELMNSIDRLDRIGDRVIKCWAQMQNELFDKKECECKKLPDQIDQNK